jgi:hypothetical protein
LEADLSPALRDRFVRTREGMGIGPGRYAHWKPAIAGFLLIADFREKYGLSTGKPTTTVTRRAKALGVKIQPMADMSWGSMVKSASVMKGPAHEACLTAALNDLDAEAARAAADQTARKVEQTSAQVPAGCRRNSQAVR